VRKILTLLPRVVRNIEHAAGFTILMKKRTMAFFGLVIVAFLITNYIQQNKEYAVKDVVDGDTFNTIDGRSVRLIGVNAPELGQPCSFEAKAKLEEILSGGKVMMEADAGDKDVYGRLLRYVYVDDLFVNEEMVRLGLAVTEEIEPNNKYASLFQTAEDKARKAGRCIWK
jgi:endonuclease YncB( thermonuclease family)